MGNVLLQLPRIARKKGGPGEDSFESLRSVGINLVQDLARSIWTDYNEHDPGVTILEQVCYALTDIMYRAGFPVEDLLTGEDGEIDWKAQGLLPPEIAFPCRPTTTLDYDAVIRDAVIEETENVRIDPIPETERSWDGLYRIVLRMKTPDGTQDDRTEDGAEGNDRGRGNDRELEDRVRKAFAGARNLCEDLDDVRVLSEVDYSPKARVDIEEHANPAEVLARIYYECRKKIAAGIEFRRFDQVLSQGKSPEEAFRGPFTLCGVIAKDNGPSLQKLSELDLFALIKDVDGVENATVEPADPDPRGDTGAVLRLRLPDIDARRNPLADISGRLDVKVFRGGGQKPMPVSWHDFMMSYKQQHFAERIIRRDDALKEIVAILPRPQGRIRNIEEYSSVQYQFPGIYGVGSRGVPAYAGPGRQAWALQLKGYLLLFDQHMADYLAMLGNLRRLFSTVEPRPRAVAGVSDQPDRKRETYFCQVLGDDAFPGIARFYPRYAEGALKKLLSDYNHNDRTRRLLDYLLALYGESFRDDSLRTPASARSAQTEGAALDAKTAEDDAILDEKYAWLRDIEAVTRDRAAAADYTRDFGESRSGLEARLSRLLGFEKNNHITGECVRVIEHILLRPTGQTRKDVPADFYRFRISVLFPAWPEPCRDENFKRLAEEMVRSSCPAHIFAEVHWIDRERMQVFDGLYRTWWELDKREPAAQADAANALIEFLCQIGRRELGRMEEALSELRGLESSPVTGETYRLIEHTLLRPTATETHKDVPANFYPFRIAVLFPECGNRRLMNDAEEAVHANCPAHLHADIYWLRPDEMARFDRLHRYWRKRRETAASAPSVMADAAARALIGFLGGKRKKRTLEEFDKNLAALRGPDRKPIAYRLIEHRTLRPTTAETHKDVSADFYSCRIAVLLPGNKDSGETAAVERVVHSGCPDYIRVEIHWLRPDEMARFDRLHRNWRKRREKAASAPSIRADAAARVLIGFLQGKYLTRRR